MARRSESSNKPSISPERPSRASRRVPPRETRAGSHVLVAPRGRCDEGQAPLCATHWHPDDTVGPTPEGRPVVPHPIGAPGRSPERLALATRRSVPTSMRRVVEQSASARLDRGVRPDGYRGRRPSGSPNRHAPLRCADPMARWALGLMVSDSRLDSVTTSAVCSRAAERECRRGR